MENEKELEQVAEVQEPVEEVQPQAPETQESPAVEQTPKKVKKIRRRPWPLKILLGLVAFALCIAMFVVTIAGAVVVDLRVMTSTGGIKEVLTQLFMPTNTASDRLSAGMTLTAASPVPGTNDSSSADMSNFLLDAAFDILQQQFGEDVPISKEQVSEFLDQSTAKDFLAEKFSGVVDDLLNDTNNTTITREEIMDLVKDNKELIQDTFEITIDDEMIDQMEEALEEVEFFDELEDKGFVGIVTEALTGTELEGAMDGVNEMQESLQMVKDILAGIGDAISDSTLFSIIGAFVALFLLVFLANFSLPKTLSDTGIVLTFAGLILSAPNFLINSGTLYTMLPAEASGAVALFSGLLTAVQGVHFGILGAGVALIVLAIVAKVFKNKRQKKLLEQCA